MRTWLVPVIAFVALATAAFESRAQPVPAPNWAGFYIGVSAGARWAENRWATTDVAPTLASILSDDPNPVRSFESVAARIGGYIGYNWMIAPAWIAGVEADIGWANNKKSFAPIPGTVQNDIVAIFSYINQPHGAVDETWDASVRGRLGTLIAPDVLLFGTAGVAWQHVELNARCPISGGATDWCTLPHNESHSKTMTGWTAGGGLERIMGPWILRADYRYADFGTFSRTFFTFDTTVPFDDRFTANVKVRTHTATLGIAYTFGGH